MKAQNKFTRHSMKPHPESGFLGMPETINGDYVSYKAYEDLEKKHLEIQEKLKLYELELEDIK